MEKKIMSLKLAEIDPTSMTTFSGLTIFGSLLSVLQRSLLKES